jgi:aminoglycoside phosphotransferase (APT) family kinase protein
VSDVDAVRAELVRALGGRPTDIAPLLGGAGRSEMWSFRVGERDLVFRRHVDGDGGSGGRAWEWRILRDAYRAGVPVPEPVAEAETGIVMARVPGEARPRRLLRDERWRGARAVLVEQVAAAVARLHALAVPEALPAGFPLGEAAPFTTAAPTEQAVADLERLLDGIDEPHPVIELGLRWLRANAPATAARSVVHGDLRLSNLIVGEEGLRAVIDWELVHAGDGAEDLGWMCIRSWRFGAVDRPALGCGTREQLLSAYEEAGGRKVTLDELRWWEVCGNARWAVVCLVQAAPDRHVPPSLERAMIGRRACEAEWDLLQLLAGERLPPPPRAEPQDRPTAADLLALVSAYLHELRPAAPSDHAFRLLVAANACSVVARELAADFVRAQPGARQRAYELAAALRAGEHDDCLDALVDPLRAATRWRLQVANPGWDDTNQAL